ncbi:hypothetical protein B0H34DRAFT_803234 [Crassisporium funariophilum]|nr:hypothetical protein B0H34DRAFT_803234 [Crassisporium funariophilum]
MFKFFNTQLLGTLASVVLTSAVPLELNARHVDITENVIVCTGTLAPMNGCVTIPVGSDTCTSFTGGFSFLNKEVSNARIPDGFVCTFFTAAGCIAPQGGGDVVLQGGDWNFFAVPGTATTVNFNDQASSFSCSTI